MLRARHGFSRNNSAVSVASESKIYAGRGVGCVDSGVAPSLRAVDQRNGGTVRPRREAGGEGLRSWGLGGGRLFVWKCLFLFVGWFGFVCFLLVWNHLFVCILFVSVFLYMVCIN